MSFYGQVEQQQELLSWSRLGNSIVAANSITSVVRQLAMVFAFGLANTAAIMVGKEIGKKDFHTAEIYAKTFIILFSFKFIRCCFAFVVKPFIIKKFALNAEVEDYFKSYFKYFILLYTFTKYFSSFNCWSF